VISCVNSPVPKALLVDTNFSSWPILRALEAWDIEVHVVGANPADALSKAHPRHHALDYSYTDALARLVETLRPDYVVPGCNDRSYISCAAVAEGGRFPGIDSPENTRNINDKAAFRAVAGRLGLSIPKVFDWPAETPQCPVIVKPVDAFSGKGITIVRQPDYATLEAAVQVASGVSRSGRAIVEEFVEGQLHSHSAFVAGGRIVQDFWVIEHCSVNPFVVDVSHLVDDLDETVKAGMRSDIEHLARGLGLVDGLLHTQFIVSGDRHAIVEITRRCPGDLYSQLIQLSTGIDYPAAYAAPFAGRSESPSAPDSRLIMRHTLTGNRTVSLQHLRFLRPLAIDRWVPLATGGDELRPSPLGRTAILFAQASSEQDLRSLVDATVSGQLYQVNA